MTENQIHIAAVRVKHSLNISFVVLQCWIIADMAFFHTDQQKKTYFFFSDAN